MNAPRTEDSYGIEMSSPEAMDLDADATLGEGSREDEALVANQESSTSTSNGLNEETLPRFLRDRTARKKPIVARYRDSIIEWAKGPSPPQIQKIRPWFPHVQEYPVQLLDMYLPKRHQKILLLLVFCTCWLLSFGTVLQESTVASEVPGYGEPVILGCGNTFFWPGNGCGVNGVNCRPFDNQSFAFRCPAACSSYMALNPRAVGAQEILYAPFIVGGAFDGDEILDPVYRGDSFLCGAAIHAGVISDAAGGCGVITKLGEGTNYNGTVRNGLRSLGFDSSFPVSFTFSGGVTCEAKDMRWPLLAVSLSFSVLLSLFTASPGVFYFSIFTALFVHTGFASDPPLSPVNTADLFSNLIGKFLPAMFCALVIYNYYAVKTLTGLTAQVEKTLLWLGGCWIGTLSNYTFEWIPIQRLNGHDLAQQPGAKLALACIIVLLLCIVIQQIYYFRLEGRFPRYLGLYTLFLLNVILSLLLPNLNLRIHHYVLALFLLPGTSMQTRPALLYQGLLLGLFINGIARWGFDPVLQTSAALQGDAQHDSALPVLLDPLVSLGTTLSNITFEWATPLAPFMDGISVLVNDVERFRGYGDEGSGSARAALRFTWSRDASRNENEYFRFGYMQGTDVGDYTKAGTWLTDGSWRDMEPGPSRLGRRGVGEELLR